MDFIPGKRYDLTVARVGRKTAFLAIDGGHGALAILRSSNCMHIKWTDLAVGTRLRGSLEPIKRDTGMYLARCIRLKGVPTRKVE
jgi:hypothetical protein